MPSECDLPPLILLVGESDFLDFGVGSPRGPSNPESRVGESYTAFFNPVICTIFGGLPVHTCRCM